MGKVRDILGLLASVMALSSLVYGAFQEPLVPYMQGIMGGVMDVYRLMRDYVFSGLGWTFSGLINLIGQWLTWLPPAPWFVLRGGVADAFLIYLLIGSYIQSWISDPRTLDEENRIRNYAMSGDLGFEDELEVEDYLAKGREYSRSFHVRAFFWMFSLAEALLWPRYVWRAFVGQKILAAMKSEDASETNPLVIKSIQLREIQARKFVRGWATHLLAIVLGSALFFLLVDAENRIGF